MLASATRQSLVALLLGCASALGQSSYQPPAAASDQSAQIFKQLLQDWARNLHDKRIDACVAAYAPDADFIQPDSTVVHGTSALRKLFETITATFDSDLVFNSRRVETSGDLAYDSGTYTETLILRASNKVQHSSGSYLTVYRRDPSGTWHIVEQAWTGTIQ